MEIKREKKKKRKKENGRVSTIITLPLLFLVHTRSQLKPNVHAFPLWNTLNVSLNQKTPSVDDVWGLHKHDTCAPILMVKTSCLILESQNIFSQKKLFKRIYENLRVFTLDFTILPLLSLNKIL